MAGSVGCSACPAGTRKDSATGTCVACGIGTFSAAEGATECSPCAAGFVATVTGSVGCSPCPAGTVSNALQSQCTPCPIGTYSPVAGALSCTACALGSVATVAGSVACTSCPAGHRALLGTSCEVCPPDTFAREDGLTCVDCPSDGVMCRQGQLFVLPGFWHTTDGLTAAPLASIDNSTVLFKCPEGACDVAQDGNVSCAEGLTGPMCGTCVEGYVRDGLGLQPV